MIKQEILQKYFEASVRTFAIMGAEDQKYNGDRYETGESPYLYPLDMYKELIEDYLGLTEEEVEKINSKAVDLAYDIIHDLQMI